MGFNCRRRNSLVTRASGFPAEILSLCPVPSFTLVDTLCNQRSKLVQIRSRKPGSSAELAALPP